MTAGWAWLAIVVFAAVFEAHAVATHTMTLSQFVWLMEHKHAWFRWGVGALILALALHLTLLHWP